MLPFDCSLLWGLRCLHCFTSNGHVISVLFPVHHFHLLTTICALQSSLSPCGSGTPRALTAHPPAEACNHALPNRGPRVHRPPARDSRVFLQMQLSTGTDKCIKRLKRARSAVKNQMRAAVQREEDDADSDEAISDTDPALKLQKVDEDKSSRGKKQKKKEKGATEDQGLGQARNETTVPTKNTKERANKKHKHKVDDRCRYTRLPLLSLRRNRCMWRFSPRLGAICRSRPCSSPSVQGVPKAMMATNR